MPWNSNANKEVAEAGAAFAIISSTAFKVQ
jgi:hypothetical protein